MFLKELAKLPIILGLVAHELGASKGAIVVRGILESL
jgi:hypothetical protein